MSKRDRKKKQHRRPGQSGGRVTPPKARWSGGVEPAWGFDVPVPPGSDPPFRSASGPHIGARPLPPLRSLIGAAVHGHVSDADELVATAVDGVVAHAREPGGRQVVERVLAERLLSLVGTAWQYGWQPADLVRTAARTCSLPERRLLARAISVEARRYLPTTIDPHWADQLRAVVEEVEAIAEVVPGGEEPAWVMPSGEDTRSSIETALSTAGFMARLPQLPVLCRLPGQGSSRGPVAHHVDEGVLRRVRGMLAKAESTEFDEEAAAFTAKAQELMARHAIDHMVLAAAAVRKEAPGGIRLGVDDPYAQAKAMLLAEVAEANRCRTVWSSGLGFSTVVGFVDDLEAVELLYTSLLVQATVSMRSYGSRQTADGRSRTRSFRKAFLLSFASRIGQRLRDASDAARGEALERHGDRLLPVLADRRSAVDEEFGSVFPDVTFVTGATATDAEGWAAGRAAADLAALWGADEVGQAGG